MHHYHLWKYMIYNKLEWFKTNTIVLEWIAALGSYHIPRLNNKQPVESKDHPGWILMTVGILSEIIIADMCILDGLSMYCCWLPDAVPCC